MNAAQRRRPGSSQWPALISPSTFDTSPRICTSQVSYLTEGTSVDAIESFHLAPGRRSCGCLDRGIAFSHSPDRRRSMCSRMRRLRFGRSAQAFLAWPELRQIIFVQYATVMVIRNTAGRTSSGTRGTLVLYRAAAINWRDATSIAEQDKILSTHGVRWSELWRLSIGIRLVNWLSIPCTVCSKRLAQKHFRVILGLDFQ